MEYKEQLLTNEWITKKTKVLIRDRYKCTKCKKKDCKLHVHHLYYVKDHLAWQYPYNALTTLCDICHKEWHKQNLLEVRDKPWSRKSGYIPPKKDGYIEWRKLTKREKKNNQSLGVLQVNTNRYRRKVNGNWVIADDKKKV